jgi:hypothetical protein
MTLPLTFDGSAARREYGVALDLGTERTGWCRVLDDRIIGADVLVAKRVPPAKRDNSTAAAQTAQSYALVCEMATAIRHRLTNSLPQLKWVAAENIYLATHQSKDLRKATKTNAHTHEILAALKFAVILWCFEHSVPYYQASTAEIDSACAIPSRLKRVDRKKQTVAFANAMGWTLPQDACDALAVAWWAKAQRRLDMMVEESGS